MASTCSWGAQSPGQVHPSFLSLAASPPHLTGSSGRACVPTSRSRLPTRGLSGTCLLSAPVNPIVPQRRMPSSLRSLCKAFFNRARWALHWGQVLGGPSSGRSGKQRARLGLFLSTRAQKDQPTSRSCRLMSQPTLGADSGECGPGGRGTPMLPQALPGHMVFPVDTVQASAGGQPERPLGARSGSL